MSKKIIEMKGRELKQMASMLDADNIMVFDNDMNNVDWLFILLEEDEGLDMISDSKTYHIEG